MIILYLLAFLLLRHLKRIFASKIKHNSNSLLLIAHPDDETMFFTPTLCNLKNNLTILCLSEGNYYGKGKIRKKELIELTDYLSHTLSELKIQTIILDLPDNEDWNISHVYSLLNKYHKIYKFNTIYTFDKNGVSNHKNHVFCSEVTEIFCKKNPYVKGKYLISNNIFYKYFINLNILRNGFALPYNFYFLPFKMMAFHKSQLIWFRYFYILFSNYTLYNEYS
ncbi:N-acetylglucosaminyl-phosphatidylinositol de-N-acetylase [Astathelohania contejeani]|uniref:N-acetylglucosaminylphosphatidylinositol deacetylase n=1 Tax=Astathelohania contejeani TaxID=164912 RepID=A0ABQ7I2D5_9MICR|nr:N-acetylglucosaminyl-phosphatidylinositol de-N-acetylase [Thelohania contejeani]